MPAPSPTSIFVETNLGSAHHGKVDWDAPYFVNATLEEALVPGARFLAGEEAEEDNILTESFENGAILVFTDGEVRFFDEASGTLLDGNAWAKKLYNPGDLDMFRHQMSKKK